MAEAAHSRHDHRVVALVYLVRFALRQHAREARLHQTFIDCLSVCIRQDSGAANKHEVWAGPAPLLRFQRDDVENQKRSYLCTRNFSFQGFSVSAFLLTSK